MVTLRRDVAVQNSNRIFDKIERESLTDYDIFMREKRMGELNRSSSACAQAISRNSFDLDSYSYFSAPQVTVVEPKQEKTASYDDYMRAQLHRTSGEERILSESEFYSAKHNENSTKEVVKTTSKQKANRRQLSKFGKIFLTAYVLITIAVASIILALNLNTQETVTTRAIESDSEGISALAMEVESEESNLFDDVLDTFSNK